ncbi:MAG: Ldh family oxidoreductase [Solirubrobacterales bacterium]|nr:Ldh family oxidoreductase [Solirubrobacterales bacterium]
MDAEGSRVNVDRLLELTAAMLAAAGVAQTDARTVAASLVDADLRGIHSHGVGRLAIYVERLRTGGNQRTGEPAVVLDAPSLAVLDAGELLAQVGSARAVEIAATKARTTGSGVVSVRGASHFGAAGYWARLLADQGMLGVAACNTTPVMAAWAGSTTAIGSNPLAMAFPSAGDAPVVVDVATSETTWGALLQAETAGTPIPDTWALGLDGRPTTSPVEAVAAGRLRPFARHKGYALAVGVELLSGALAGANCLSRVAHLYLEPDRPMGAGLFFVAVDPGALSEEHARGFAKQVHEVQQELGALPPQNDGERVLWPGQLEAERAMRGVRDGVPLPPPIAESLISLARELGVGEGVLAPLETDGSVR